jgi:hypothetical protein
MKKKETLIRFWKLYILILNFLFVLLLSKYIIYSTHHNEDLNNSNLWINYSFQTIDNFYAIIKNYTELKLMKIFGEKFGNFLFLCLRSWMLGLIASSYIIRKVHQTKLVKLGAI